MGIQHINPDTLFDSTPYGFSQVVVGVGKRIICCAGQTANDKDLQIIGVNDFGKQAEYALENVRRALAAAGAGPEHIVSTRMYVVGYTPVYLELLAKVIGNFYGDLPAPANTMVGVTALALPEFLIEIEATAVLD